MNRILHIGVGNFHRAHQAWYTSNTPGWAITGVVMKNRALFEDLTRQDNRYLLGTWGKDGLTSEVIAVYDDLLLAADAPEKVMDAIAAADTHVVTLTVTEKGYYLDDEGAGLDLADPDIQADLAAETPSTAIGLLAEGLIRRASQTASPITIVCCDNLSNNGRKLEKAVQNYLTEKAPSVVEWLAANARFPNTMVDRITPRLTDGAAAEITASAGSSPDMPVVGTETFSEWVIEDDFAGPKPGWDAAGAVFVADVASFEHRKLRLLNASHSYLAYAGQLAGHRYVHEAIADPALLTGVHWLWDEAATTLSGPAAASVAEYREALIDRFSVPAMRHDLGQIAMDGSLKLKERLVPIYLERQAAGLSSPTVLTAFTAWIDFAREKSATGQALQDPNAEAIADICSAQSDPTGELLALIGMPTRP